MLKFYKSEWLGDWYCLDGAPFGQPEGTKGEWESVIFGIENDESGLLALGLKLKEVKLDT